MARDKGLLANIDLSDPVNYPNGRIKNNSGSGNGTPVNEIVYGDLHETFAKLMRLYELNYNGLPDNEANEYQLVKALEALASKNDYVLDLTVSQGEMFVPLKISKLKENESFILKATFDRAAETVIRGSLDNTNKTVTFLGNFKTGEYVRMINTGATVVLVRMVDFHNVGSIIEDLGYLTKASQAEEDAGTIETKATTPKTNKTAFVERINGGDSSSYLAKPLGDVDEKNGLLSKEDKKKIDDFVEPEEWVLRTGVVNASGAKIKGINFTSQRLQTGHYRLVHTLGNTDYVVLGSGLNDDDIKVCVIDQQNNFCDVGTSDDSSTNDSDFSFMIFKTIQ